MVDMPDYESPFITETGYANTKLIGEELIRKVNEYHSEDPDYYPLRPGLWAGDLHITMREDHPMSYVYVQEYIDQDSHYRWVQAREKFAQGDDRAYHEMLSYVTMDNPPERPESHYLKQRQSVQRYIQEGYWIENWAIWAVLAAILPVLFILIFG